MADHLSLLEETFHAHEPRMVALSIIIAILASYVSLELAAMTRVSSTRQRGAWGTLAALTMGGGIWSMHFVAITAMRLPNNTAYDAPLTMLSMAIAIVCSGLGLFRVFRHNPTWRTFAIGGTIMGSGVAAMHYCGMAAITLPGPAIYNPVIVLASIAVAIVAATTALWLAINLQRRDMRVLSAFVMGAAISGMHFTGMAALSYEDMPANRPVTVTGVLAGEVTIEIVLAALLICIGGLLLVYIRYVSRRLNQSALREIGLAAMAAESFTVAAERALESMRQVLRVDTAVVTLFDPSRDLTTRIISQDNSPIRVETSAISEMRSDSPYKMVMDLRTALKTSGSDSPEDNTLRAHLLDSSLRSILIVPASRSKQATTVISVFSRDVRVFSDSDEQFVRSIAEMLTLIGDRDKASAELRLRDQALTSITQGITISDVRGVTEVITYANPAFAKMIGYPIAEIVGSDPKRYVASVEAEHVGEQISLAKAKKRAMRLEVKMRRKDGTTFLDEMNGSPMLNDDGEMTHAVLVHEDLTETKAREEKLRELQRLETVGQLTGGVAHDFNNLLTVVKANAEDLAQELKDQEDLGFQASMILEAADRGADLIRQLMAFSRKQELEPEAVDLNALLDVVAGLARRTFPATIDVVIKKGSDLPAVNVDAGQLQTAILNIAVNGRDAMEQGGTLTIETSSAELDREYAKENLSVQAGKYALIAISDTGEGMEPHILRRVFDPFFTTKEVGKGTGLGLSMVYGFVRQSGGHVKVYSEPSIGTTVKIYLPAIRAAGHAPVMQQESVEERPQSGSILLVEDDPLVRKSVTNKLHRMGYKVLAVASAAEAIADLEKSSFALVFSDVVMPGTMNGADLVREIARRWPGTRVLLTSGYTEAAVLGKVNIPKGVRLLSKPYTNDALSDAISRLLVA